MRRFWPLLVFVVMLGLISVRSEMNQDATPAQDKSSYQRIISLSPSITETVFALGLGEQVVAVTDFCDYPPQAQDLPSVGGYTDTSLEAVVAMQPDLVIMLKAQQKLRQQLEYLGIQTHQVDNHELLGIQAGIASIGQRTGTTKQADVILTEIQKLIEQVQAKLTTTSPVRTMLSIAHHVNSDQLDTVYIAGQNDFYNDLLQLAGGENVYAGNTIMVPSVSPEGIIRMNPDVIIDIFPEADDHNSDMNQVKAQWQTLRNVSAVQSDRVHIIERDYASVPGPRVFRLLPEIAQLLHPELDWTDIITDD